ncbi:glycerophosphodiester phosphodiesterase 1-like [Anopheles albimanus]|nr:glycerophosphodiester phosphodiesterase 1-like [Anopheles albimanus]
MNLGTVIKICKMLFQLFWFLATCCTFVVNALWLCCNFASVSFPWLMLMFFLVLLASKFVKLKSPSDEVVRSLLWKSEKEQGCGDDWPILNRGGGFDAPDNSLAAINQCLAQKCQKILLNLSVTSDGQAILLHKSTLEKANINEPPQKLHSSFFENFSITEHHPLGQLFQSEKVLTFEKLLKLLESSEVTVFLLASQITPRLLEIIREAATRCPVFTKRIIFCCSSPVAIYQLRQRCPDLVCGLWMEKSYHLRMPHYLNSSTILLSVLGAIYRNIIAPVIGISIVFIHKDEYNAQISTLWKNVGVRPIVYTINSPNEKRYFQQVTKTLYLTDSLRSEPHLIFKTRMI